MEPQGSMETPEIDRRNRVIYCLFTLSKFRGDQGISIIATPQTAAGAVGMLELDMLDGKWS